MNIVPALAHLAVSAAAILLVAKVAPGFRVRDFSSALIAAIVIGVVNAVIRPFLDFFTFPFYILTFGAFTFVIDAVVLKLCAAFVKGFDIDGWRDAIIGSLLLAIANAGLHRLLV